MNKSLSQVTTRALGLILLVILLMWTGLFVFFTSQATPVFAEERHICQDPVNIPIIDWHWTYVPISANQLYTEERYFFLAGQLIENGVVDAGDCPAGGLMLNGYANACGMARAMPTVITVQNLLNEPILQAWQDVGVPPVLLKRLISVESQFWPSRHTNIHYGYGHITNLGIRNALQWNPSLTAKVCPPGTADTCPTSIPIADQILTSLIATCETCDYGIDPLAANRSVDLLAEVLMGYCYQTARLVFNATGWHAKNVVNYATIWKLTLMNYNAGTVCVFDTVNSAFKVTEGPMDWAHIVRHTSGDNCLRGLHYANQVTEKYFDFPPVD